MTNIVPLNNQLHRTLRVLPTGAEQRNFVGVVIAEFNHLAAHYPILFSKDPETGAFYCGAMLGFDPGENLFQQQGSAIYRPLNLQRGPFYAAGQEIAIDLDSPQVGQGERVFDDRGAPSPYLNAIMGLFRELVPGIERTRNFIEALLSLKLIEPIDIKIEFDDGTSRRLESLYTVNLDRLRELQDSDVLHLFRHGYLQLIYVMGASLAQISILARRKNSMLHKGADVLP